MKHRINVRGVIIPNDYKWYYNWFKMDSTCPNDVSKVLEQVKDGDEVEVYVNSPGGVIDVGSEIYTALHSIKDKVKIYVTGEACSAASIISMAAYCEMSPTALMMVHCVSTEASGNHSKMEKTAEVLRTADNALCSAYMEKAGMSQEEALDMMEKETWLTAQQALDAGLIDAIMFSKEDEKVNLVDGPLFALPSEEMMQKTKEMIQNSEKSDTDKANLDRAKANLELLMLRGERK